MKEHKGMTIAGDGASMLGKLMREQYASRGGVYPDGNPNAALERPLAAPSHPPATAAPIIGTQNVNGVDVDFEPDEWAEPAVAVQAEPPFITAMIDARRKRYALDQTCTPAFLQWLDTMTPREGVGANEAWNAGVAWAISAHPKPAAPATAEDAVSDVEIVQTVKQFPWLVHNAPYMAVVVPFARAILALRSGASAQPAEAEPANPWADLWYFVMDEAPLEFERIVTTHSPKNWHTEAHKLMRAKEARNG